MIFFWVKSNRIGSRLIRWGLNEPCSHFAICFCEDSLMGFQPMVVESKLQDGVQRTSLTEFLDHYEVVHAVQMPTQSLEELQLMKKVLDNLQGKEYDQWAIAYWFFAGLARKVFKCKLPLRNQWGKNELVYCVEVLQAMPEYLADIGIDLNEFDLEMTSPEMAYEIVMNCANVLDITEHF